MLRNGLASVDPRTDPLPFPLVPCLCLGKGVCSARIAFLSTAAPRRGTLPDLEQQPSPKLFQYRQGQRPVQDRRADGAAAIARGSQAQADQGRGSRRVSHCSVAGVEEPRLFCALRMFDSFEVKVLSQPDGGAPCSYLPPTDPSLRASSIKPFEMCAIRTGRRPTVPAHERFYQGRRCCPTGARLRSSI